MSKEKIYIEALNKIIKDKNKSRIVTNLYYGDYYEQECETIANILLSYTETVNRLEFLEGILKLITDATGETTLRLHNTRPDCRLSLLNEMLNNQKEKQNV